MEGSTGLNNMGSDTVIKLAGPRNVIKDAEVKLILKYRVTRVVGFGPRPPRLELEPASL